jgi:hypothetical protein
VLGDSQDHAEVFGGFLIEATFFEEKSHIRPMWTWGFCRLIPFKKFPFTAKGKKRL